jgi:hypothetical protein
MDVAREFLEEPEPSPDIFFSIIDSGMQGMIQISAIGVACEMGIFDLLEEAGRTADDLAGHLNSSERMLAPLCTILSGIGLLAESDQGYRNTPLASTYLTSKSPYFQGNYIRKHTVFFHQIWAPLFHLLVHGPLILEKDTFFRNLSLPAMADNALCGRLQRTVREISRLPEFAGCRTMLDLGGGHGLYAIAMCAVNRGLHARVFDYPHVLPVAHEYIRKYGATRVSVLGGDFFTDDFGTGYDLIFSSSNPSGKSIELLPVIAAALAPGGFFVNVQSDDGESRDAYQELEGELWTLDTTSSNAGGRTKEQAFLTPGYREALSSAGLTMIHETRIRDDYHARTFVHMMIAKKVKN